MAHEADLTAPLLDGADGADTAFAPAFRTFDFCAGSSMLAQPFASNRVTTSKYTMLSFGPKFLGATFAKMTNVYFLFICVLEMTPGISTSGGIPTTALPLLVVIAVDAFFQIIEDYARHLDDDVANQRVAYRLCESGAYEPLPWADVRVGDVLRVANGAIAAADMVLLQVESEPGEASRHYGYVETSSLDGETNLKLREAIAETTGRTLWRLRGRFQCDPPSAAMHAFSGQLLLDARIASIPVHATNVLLRGCTLRNTTAVHGLVFATGHDTKVLQCAQQCPNKRSAVETQVNRELWCMVVLLLCCCGAAATVSTIFDCNALQNAWYMHLERPNVVTAWSQAFLRFFLMLSNVVPISLVVTLNMVKSLQATLMERDRHLANGNVKCKVKTMALNEDLGQVSHIVTDKTGTLTRNVMVFRACVVGGVLYGSKHAPPTSKWMAFADARFSRQLAEGDPALSQFLLHLALSHSVLAAKPTSLAELVAAAASPDEQALLAMAYAFGYRFLGRSPGAATVHVPGSGAVAFEILHVLEFTSARKRMSVVLRNPLEGGRVELLTKGADSVLLPRSATADATAAHLNTMAADGLRTLVIARRVLSDSEFAAWDKAYQAVVRDAVSMRARAEGRPNAIDDLADRIEVDLDVLGATGIEDGLQDHVPETIEALRLAGVKIWMLTGDHVDTAANVARACNLLKNTTVQLSLLGCTSPSGCFLTLRELQRAMLPRAKYALVVDGDALYHVMNDGPALDAFATVVRQCEVVLACRTSPMQKAQIVELVQVGGCLAHGRVLAIGDGANDVAMIQTAHVGVGISGQEGLQAANCSDYAVGEFSFLLRLLFVHGRLNYQRTTFLVRYVFYKNVILVMSEFWYSLVSGVSGQKFYNEVAVDCFNTLYTALPIVLFAIMDKDLPSWMCVSVPGLYSIGMSNGLFRRRMIWSWIASGVFESLVICMVAVLTMRSVDSLGRPYGMWESGALVFTQIVLVVNYKLALHQSSWSLLQALVLGASVLAWFVSAFVISASPDISTAWFDIFPIVMTSNFYWFASLLIPALALAGDFVGGAVANAFAPTNVRVLQEALKDPAQKETLRYRLWQLPEKQPTPGSGYASAADEFTAQAEARRSTVGWELPGYEIDTTSAAL
ncbi:phospholipid-transporting ATPase [Achlya hypogyna]|uniref:Phospholipid-transporting ATPase n=1 Tax=Achlya hypogyna TaxID=1202772 RepID=A0A1V9YBR6_ACHHY|nr:phospholipid-transporting ATPase [Achlya hypogyna]